VQELAVVGFPSVQVHPVSTAQVDEQPSPPVVLPSSQYPEVGFMTFPSPQMSEQILAVEESPKVHVQSVSTFHVASQPSFGVVLPSSHFPKIGLIVIPSPHISVQELAVVESPSDQVHPVSTAQVEDQPSPPVIPPSSQYPVVGFSTLPSPQISEHTLAVEESPKVHFQLVSTPQLPFHPSLGVVLPSSQYPEVGFITFPSPQISVQMLAVKESPKVHDHPVSTTQLEFHPSPAIVFPSSQVPAAGLILIPSPQISDHELAVDESPNVHVHPVSTAQLLLHPSPATIPLSSQYPAVGFITIPSPQISVQILAVVESPKVQLHPVSIDQVELQPSLLLVSPSSQ